MPIWIQLIICAIAIVATGYRLIIYILETISTRDSYKKDAESYYSPFTTARLEHEMGFLPHSNEQVADSCRHCWEESSELGEDRGKLDLIIQLPFNNLLTPNEQRKLLDEQWKKQHYERTFGMVYLDGSMTVKEARRRGYRHSEKNKH